MRIVANYDPKTKRFRVAIVDQGRIVEALYGSESEVPALKAQLAKKGFRNPGGPPRVITIDPVAFAAAWQDPYLSKAGMARRFKCSKSTIERRGREMKLGRKA